MQRRVFNQLASSGLFLPVALGLTSPATAQQTAVVSDGFFPMLVWPPTSFNQFKSNFPNAGEPQRSSLLSLQLPSVALAGNVNLGLEFEGDVPVALALFQIPMSRISLENKFQGSEEPLMAMRLSAKAVPSWQFQLKFEQSTRWLAVLATATGMFQAEAITRLGSSQAPKTGKL